LIDIPECICDIITITAFAALLTVTRRAGSTFDAFTVAMSDATPKSSIRAYKERSEGAAVSLFYGTQRRNRGRRSFIVFYFLVVAMMMIHPYLTCSTKRMTALATLS
jgi:hypothetical protein